MLRELKDNAPKNGQELVGAFSVPTTTRQFGPIAAKVREVNPDAVYVAYFGQTMVAMIKQLRDGGVDKPFIGYSAFNDPDLMALPASEGALYSSQKMDWASSDPVTARFVADFQKRFNKLPSFYSANYYNAVLVTAKAMASLEKKNNADDRREHPQRNLGAQDLRRGRRQDGIPARRHRKNADPDERADEGRHEGS